jgi:hypothetical protein
VDACARNVAHHIRLSRDERRRLSEKRGLGGATQQQARQRVTRRDDPLMKPIEPTRPTDGSSDNNSERNDSEHCCQERPRRH